MKRENTHGLHLRASLVLVCGSIGLAGPAWATAAPTVSANDCAPVLSAFDQRVEQAGVGWSQAVRVSGFAHLRVDRFLASFRDQTLDAAARRMWLEHMRALDRRGREFELERLGGESSKRAKLAERMEACANQNMLADLSSESRFQRVRKAAHAPDAYLNGARVFGVYPLTFIPVAIGVQRLQQDIKTRFSTVYEAPTAEVQVRRYLPPVGDPKPATAVAFDTDELGIPQIEAEVLAALYDRHAPVWEIATRGRFDMPGAPYWRADGLPDVDPSAAVVYRFSSWTRWGEDTLLQLNYLVWFSERPLETDVDLLGGHLDGLLWRVTLAPDGSVLVYDSVHPCGCYHMLLPRPDLRLRPELENTAEPPLVPASAPAPEAGTRLVLRVDSSTHYLTGAYRQSVTDGMPYQFRDYDELQRIVDAEGKVRGLFRDDGLVAGTERAERWVLWPMGVVSPGAMRGRGHQAVAFVGRRHFDDPYLLEQIFEYR